MPSFLSFEEIKQWRSSTEKITLEEFAQKLGKQIQPEKEERDLYDIIKIKDEPKSELLFTKELSEREKAVFNHLNQNRHKKVHIGELARILGLPNSYVYKYIRNLRGKMAQNVLHNAEGGGYILE